MEKVFPKVLITGSQGMLAWDLQRFFEQQYGREAVVALDREALDITQEPSILAALQQYQPQWVLNAAAYTNVDGAETDRVMAHAINAKGPALLAKLCAQSGIKLVHFGSDQVFDGTGDTPRSEDDATAPCNYYALTKHEGELAVLQGDARHLVLRVQWLYGERKDRFSPLREKTLFTPFIDQLGAPTWTREIARVVGQLLEKDARGLFHFAYDDFASWAEVFQLVKEQWGLSVQLQPKRTMEVKLPARRPLFSVLSNQKLKQFLEVSSLGSWKTPFKEFLEKVSR